MGVALAYLREETGSLMAPIVAHVANNTVAVVCYYWFPRFFT
jgi:membrane protease YdiL (CAAX protease family)